MYSSVELVDPVEYSRAFSLHYYDRDHLRCFLSTCLLFLVRMGPYEALKEVQEHYYESIDIKHRKMVDKGKSGIECNLQVETILASFGDIGSVVRSSSGVSIPSQFDMSLDLEATHFDLLVLGAGSIDKSDKTSMNYLKYHHDRGGSILTVCTGASFVAELGLLNGTEATTNSLFIDTYRKEYPEVRWMDLADNLERRFVRSTPQITTTAGITAGIDGTLYQIQEWCGEEVAEATRQCLEWPLPIHD